MVEFNELMEVVKEYFLDKAYEPIASVKDPWDELDSIIDFVRRWNRRVPVGRNKDKIKEAVLSLREEFDALGNYSIEDFVFTQENVGLVRKIFDKLSATVLKSTGTIKLMHGMNPNLFFMWDKGICMHYGVYPNSAGYINFMKLMQEEVKGLLKEHSKEEIIGDTKRTLPKLIDEYNWMHFRTSKMIS